jgi:hypothetical protein
MAIEQVSKRFTLHDILGYLFSGIFTLIIVAVLLVFNSYCRDIEVLRMVTLFRQLHLSTQVLVYMILGYFLGLVCTSIGDALYELWWDTKDVSLLDDKSKESLSLEIRDSFRKKVADLLGVSEPPSFDTKISRKDFHSVAYSYLILHEKDRFVQIMSGRGIMYSGLAGSFVICGIAGLLLEILNCTQDRPTVLLNWIVLVVCAVGVCCGLRKASKFDALWKKHVVFGFLAGDLSLEGKQKEREESQAT